MEKIDVYRELQMNMGLSHGAYSIVIGYGLLSSEQHLKPLIHKKQVMIVTNETVAPLYLANLQQALRSLQCDEVILKDGEQFKNMASTALIYDALIHKKHHRDTTLLALGGGVIGDMAGFAASTYQRGVRLIQLPTSLLAQIDASIGGKTGINHPLGKNMIGTFYQPHGVLVDLNTLQTLPLRHFRAGLAEMVKYALLEGKTFFELLKEALNQGLANHQSALLPELIVRSCQSKINMVTQDVYEHHTRALLNLGHTFAHALETYTHYERWLHGEAVGIGIYCAAMLSLRNKLINEATLLEIDDMLMLAGLPRRIPDDIDLNQLIHLMDHDKKILDKTLRFILFKNIGQCYIEEAVSKPLLLDALNASCEGE